MEGEQEEEKVEVEQVDEKWKRKKDGRGELN